MFHGHASPSRKVGEVHKGNRTSTEYGSKHRGSKQIAENISKTQSSGLLEGPQGKLNPWKEFLRQKTEEAHGCVSHSKQNSIGHKRIANVCSPREESSPRDTDDARWLNQVNSNPPNSNAGHFRFHGYTSPSVNSEQTEKSDRTSDENRNKHRESEQTEGKMAKTLSSGSLEGPAKVNPWNEFLRQKTEEEAKSRRTKDYVAERNKASKENSKPAEDSGDNVNDSRGKKFQFREIHFYLLKSIYVFTDRLCCAFQLIHRMMWY